MSATVTKHSSQLNRITSCTAIINDSKLELVKKKIICESSVLEYLENMLQTEENKLNQHLRHLTKLHHDVLNSKNNSNSENQIMYTTENKINHLETIITKYQEEIHCNSLFCIISADWIESSVYLQNELDIVKKDNESLISQITNIKTKTIQTNKNDINDLQNKCNRLKNENQNLQNILNDTHQCIEDNVQNISTLTQEHKSLKNNVYLFYKQSAETLKEIKTVISSNCITSKINMNHQMDDNKDEDTECVELLNDVYQTLCDVLKYNKDFIIQQNKLCDEMKTESAKLLSVMERKNIENEKIRDNEIKNLIKETRTNLERQYGEYNSFCDKKVEDMKKECMKYRENVLKEAKEQIQNKNKNFEIAKNLMRTRYEEEIVNIKKIYENKNKKLLNDIQMLHKKLREQKTRHQMDVDETIEDCNKEFQNKISVKEKEIADRIKMIEMRYKIKIEELIKKHDERINIERTQFKIQQNLLQGEIDKLSINFKKEIQILKRFKPHHIVHVPLNNNKGNNSSSYSSQLQEYIASNDC